MEGSNGVLRPNQVDLNVALKLRTDGGDSKCFFSRLRLRSLRVPISAGHVEGGVDQRERRVEFLEDAKGGEALTRQVLHRL